MATQTIERSTLQEVATLAADVRTEVQKAFFGGAEPVELILTTLMARGHVLLEGVPGGKRREGDAAALLGVAGRGARDAAGARAGDDLAAAGAGGRGARRGRAARLRDRAGAVHAHASARGAGRVAARGLAAGAR